MKYYLDCEFDGMGGSLLSMAMVCEDGREMYYVNTMGLYAKDPWVAQNVLPIMDSDKATLVGGIDRLSGHIGEFLAGDANPEIIADWPDDFTYFCPAVLTGPGTMIDVPTLTLRVIRVDAYPTELEGAVQHNALWDARALRHKIGGSDA